MAGGINRRCFIQNGLVSSVVMMTDAAIAQSASAFFFPPEEGPHQRTLMQWPANRSIYGASTLASIQACIIRIANAIADFEPVAMLMDQSQQAAARPKFSAAVELWDIPTDDLWCRDSGPLFVVNNAGDLAIRHIAFNGWGGRQSAAVDGLIARRVADKLKLPILETGLTGEGGAVESDGAGALLAHESSWVNPNRNRMTRAEIEAKLLAAYGARKMIWAPGLVGRDITDYHIDALARLARPGQALIQAPAKGTDIWSKAAYATYNILSAATDARGQKFTIVQLPEPRAPRVKSVDFVASYANYYVCNGAVICAQFGDAKTDAQAQDILRQSYPNRTIVALDVDALGKNGGGIHCATQQQPKTAKSV